mgnify:CR=1 FL=1
MNPSTGHLIRTIEGQELPSGYLPVPTELQADAGKALAGQDETYLSKHSGGRLGQWAAKQRKAHRHRQQAAASRRRNRG